MLGRGGKSAVASPFGMSSKTEREVEEDVEPSEELRAVGGRGEDRGAAVDLAPFGRSSIRHVEEASLSTGFHVSDNALGHT
jgi:hypothetical protein